MRFVCGLGVIVAGSDFVWTADSFVQDVSAGAWVHEGLSLFADGHRGHLVGDVVPPVFKAYARVLHPAYRRTGPAAVSRTGSVGGSHHTEG